MTKMIEADVFFIFRLHFLKWVWEERLIGHLDISLIKVGKYNIW